VTDAEPRSLLEALAAAAAGLPGVEGRRTADATEWLVRGRVFAAVAGNVAEYWLDPVIGRAALGTPDTAASPRGAEWIAFQPLELDRFALDRAIAWFGSAHRRASTLRN
jgi:hypothetical protein